MRISVYSIWGNLLLASVLTFALSGTLSAQYQEMPVDDSLASQKDAVIRSGNQEDIRNFLNKYYLARWTIRENFRQIYQFRKDLSQDVASLSGQSKKNCQNVLVEVLAEMTRNNQLAPAVRYNTALLLGSLNDQENDPATPYADALPTMLSFLSADAQSPDYVILAILINLDRYAALGIADPAQKKEAIQALVEVLEPAYGKKRGFNEDVTTWLQLKAVEGLSEFHSASGGAEGTVILDTFLRLLTDKSVDSMIQGNALRGIGGIDFEGMDQYDFAPLVTVIARYAVEVCRKESTFIDEENIRNQVSVTSTARTGATGGRGGVDSSGVETVVARVKFDLDNLRQGISGTSGRGGVLARLTAENQAPLKEALEAILEKIDETNNYLDFGEQALQKTFDLKEARKQLAQQTKRGGGMAYMVNSLQIQDYINDQIPFYQDLVDSLSGPEETLEPEPTNK